MASPPHNWAIRHRTRSSVGSNKSTNQFVLNLIKVQQHQIVYINFQVTFDSNYPEWIWQLEGHSVERIYLQQRSSDGSVNKTILKRRLALAARRQYVYVGFSRRKIPRSSAVRWQPIGNAAKFRSLYDIGESNPVTASGLWSGSGTKVNQFVHVPTSVNASDHAHGRSTSSYSLCHSTKNTNVGENVFVIQNSIKHRIEP